MIEGVPDNPHGQTDSHVEADPKPCAKHSWCVRAVGHDGKCFIKPRGDLVPSDFGPRRRR